MSRAGARRLKKQWTYRPGWRPWLVLVQALASLYMWCRRHLRRMSGRNKGTKRAEGDAAFAGGWCPLDARREGVRGPWLRCVASMLCLLPFSPIPSSLLRLPPASPFLALPPPCFPSEFFQGFHEALLGPFWRPVGSALGSAVDPAGLKWASSASARRDVRRLHVSLQVPELLSLGAGSNMVLNM